MIVSKMMPLTVRRLSFVIWGAVTGKNGKGGRLPKRFRNGCAGLRGQDQQITQDGKLCS